MASLRDAYQRVREQTERNNAAKDEGGNIFQPLFANILNELNQDLDPANVNKPLSGYGALLDSVTGFRENQIEKAAELQAKINLKAFEAGTPQRAMELAEGLAAQAEGRKQAVRNAAKVGFEGLLPTLNTKGDIDFDLVEAVNEKPALYNTINTLAPNSIFHIVPQGTPIDTSMGESIYNLPDGRQLYASGNKAFININTGRKKFIKGFNENLKAEGFSDDRIANLSREDKEELFKDRGFKKAMQNTFESQPKDFATLLDAHEQYAKALDAKTKQITDRLTTSNTRLRSLISVAVTQRDVAAKNFTLIGNKPSEKLYYLAEKRLVELQEVQLSNELDGRFLQMATSTIHRNAFAISVARGIPTNERTAAQNIDLAIKLSMNDPKLLDYKRQLRAYYYNEQPIVDKLQALLLGKKNLSPTSTVDTSRVTTSEVITGTGERATPKEKQ